MKTLIAVRSAVTVTALVVMGAGTLRAQQRSLDTTIAVRGNPRLSVSNQSGTITIRSWSRSQFRIQAESDRARIDLNETPTGVTVRTGNRGGRGDVDFTINVPTGTALELQGMSSDMDITGVCGRIDLNTLSGDIKVDCVEGGAQIQTVSGDIDLSNVRGPMDINSTSGSVTLSRARGQVSIESVSGDISMEQVESDDITAEVVSGDVDYNGRIQDGGRYKFSAHSGDVTVHLPPSATPNATVSIETFSGDFESDYQIQIGPGSQMSGKNWSFRLGNGSARVQLSSFSGTIALRRGGTGGNREE